MTLLCRMFPRQFDCFPAEILQRVILAREISGLPTFMVAVQPTRGLDVGAIEGVHRLLMAQREAGAAVLLISEELEELLSLSDRVYVIYEGKIMGEVKVGGAEPDESLIETIGHDDDGHSVGSNPKRRSRRTWLSQHLYKKDARLSYSC